MNNPISFETSIVELEQIVRQLEKGDLPLEESLQQFEKGIGLARQCQHVLQEAEQKIEILLNESQSNESNP